MQEERGRNAAIAEALRQERREVEEQQAEVIRQREAQLEAEKEQREALAQQLQDTKVGLPPQNMIVDCFGSVDFLGALSGHFLPPPLLPLSTTLRGDCLV